MRYSSKAKRIVFDFFLSTTLEDMGHTSEGQTWEYIKDVVAAEERKSRLKGGTMLADIA